MNPKKVSPQTSPLWVISLFLTLTEVVAGFAITQATGWVQGALTVFVIVFPLLVSSAFFVILWNKNYVLYPPADFSDVNVEEFVGAMKESASVNTDVLTEIRESLDAAVHDVIKDMEKLETGAENDLNDVVETISNKTLEDFEAKVISIDGSALVKGQTWIFYRPFNTTQFVSDFLDGIYFEISEFVDSNTYGTEWLLEDASTGREFRDAGRSWAETQGTVRDFRNLSEFGLFKGAKLKILKLP